jgi:flavin-dependent dehydrogenase
MQTDVVVVGGGPAGSTIAYQLAKLGYCVLLVFSNCRRDRTEVLPPSIEYFQDVLPLASALMDCQPAPFTRLRWSEVGEEVEVHSAARLVQRTKFHESLVAMAIRVGVVAVRPARARHPQRMGAGWLVPIDTATESFSARARFLVDARGRYGGMKSNRRRLGASTTTLAMRWTDAAVRAGELWIEALSDAWCWGAAPADGILETAIFIDTAECRGRGLQALTQRHRSLLGQSCRFGRALRDATAGPLSICDATATRDEAPVQVDAIRVGDAAIALDPLSSQGVLTALRTGLQAAATVHTILSGGDSNAAMLFYRQSLREAATQHQITTADLYARHQSWSARAFWRERAQAAIQGSMPHEPSRMIEADPLIIVSAATRIEQVPALVDDRIERVLSVLHPSQLRPITWMRGYPLAPLLARIGQGRRASIILADWSAAMPVGEARDILGRLIKTAIVEPVASSSPGW